MPLYYAEEEGGLFRRVNEVCDAMESQRGIKCSVHVRVLLFNSITAIREDPSPDWLAAEERRNAVALQVIEQLPSSLNAMVDETPNNNRLTFYQALHWLTRNLDSICPFEKTPRRTRRG